MSNWNGATVIVTGAASGIGLALSRAMLARGAEVWMSDVNVEGVEQAAAELGSKAHAERLDVRDAEAFRDLVERVARERGRIDYLFNNAGIGLGGESHEIGVEHYDRIIDVNIRGVTNGVAAAYPLMVKQRSGHIVNTASLAGLVPGPLMAGYTMTKHAVVGLTTSIRLEAERHGVHVSALCPSVIETPILDSQMPSDLAQPSWRPDARRYLSKYGAPYPVDRLADEALRGVEQNRALIIVPNSAKMAALVARMAPGLLARMTRKALGEALAERPASAKA
jgi:NAD(P)-dependent dehydrogenase (short-subunit alcohol dehydrogenase family)